MRVALVAMLFLHSCIHAGQDLLPPPPKPPREPTEGTVGWFYAGRVEDVTKDSITVLWPGQAPKKFAVSETLATGKIPKDPRLTPGQVRGYVVTPEYMYRLSDVKKGDLSNITYARVNGVDTCDHISIQKRPGGRVPPLPQEAERLRWPESKMTPQQIASLKPGQLAMLKAARPIPYHDVCNAYWDLKDHDIPYPEKFGRERRFPNAPAPREVVRE